MTAKLKALYWRLRKPDSVASALKQIVTSEEVEKLELQGFTGGTLLQAVAQERGFDPGSLLRAVGDMLDLAVLDNYVHSREITSELQISESFLEANDAIVCKHQQSRLLLVADLNPELKELARKHKLEICLGLLNNIKKSWQIHHGLALNSATVGTKQLEFLLKNLVLDANILGAAEIEISSETGAYHFCAKGEMFEGGIHPLAALSLLNWLEGKSKVKAKLVSEWPEPVVFYKAGDTIIVNWNNKATIKSSKENNSEAIEKLPREPYRVLLLEDDRLFSTILKSTLEKNAYQVFCFYDAERALAAIASKELVPELVISDLHLPGINGDKFLEHFREFYPDVPFVILTSDEDQLTEAELVQMGIGAYLKKSEDIRIILAWCSQLLKKYVD